MSDYKLTKEQFTDAISKGLGRAMSHIKRYGLDDVADIVLDACLHNKAYDAQCEDSRADWLYAMFNNSPQYNNFREAILSALKNENDWYETAQLCELAKEMALDGNEHARIALRDFVLNSVMMQGEKECLGIEEYIKVEGSIAVLELAKIYGQRLIENPEDNVIADLQCEEEDIVKYKQLLIEHSYSDPRIKAYFDYLDDNGAFDPIYVQPDADCAIERETRKSEFLSQYNVDRIIDRAKNRQDKYGNIYSLFGMYADKKDLEVILAQLLNEKENAVRTRLIWVFRRIPLPVIHDCFFEWIDSNDEKLRAALFMALANSKDDRIHEFARQRVKAGKILGWANSFVLDLFEKNLAIDDVKLISDAILACKPDIEDRHRFGLSITSIAEKNKTNELKDMLLWVYENTPCGNCRDSAITRLNDISALSQDIIDECTMDGCDSIREFVRGIVKQ
jgi:hypothetical protein